MCGRRLFRSTSHCCEKMVWLHPAVMVARFTIRSPVMPRAAFWKPCMIFTVGRTPLPNDLKLGPVTVSNDSR